MGNPLNNQCGQFSENACQRVHTHSMGSKLTFGIVVIIAGLLLLGFNTGLLDMSYKKIIFSWPMLFIVIGVVQLFNRSVFGGIALILIGGFFILPRLNYVDPHFVTLYWPLLIIVAGLIIVGKTIIFSKKKTKGLFYSGYTGSEIRNGVIEENNIFSGTKRQFQDMVFRGGEINCIFGGSELDLTGAVLGDGINQLEINCVFGGVSLIVPTGWTIQLKKSSIFGDFADKRHPAADHKDNSRILIIQASCIFGGGEIKSYV